MSIDVVALVTAIAGLVTAIAGLVRALRGDSDHAANLARIKAQDLRIRKLESMPAPGGEPPHDPPTAA